jgi:steroid 5-alpha reductase family enzyme
MLNPLLTNFSVIIVYMSCWYFVALLKKRNDLADVAWGLGFVIAALTNLWINPSPNWRSWVIFTLVAIWGIRLAIYIFYRNRGKGEDFRYQQWRKEWGKNVIWRSYLQIFFLQGALLTVIGLPIWFGISSDQPSQPSLLDALGILLWLVGFGFEAISDWQMSQFRKIKSTKKGIMKSGLWKYSRHPNYFGESVVWWSLYLIALANSSPIWTVIGPITITFLLVKVSGVPMLEKKYARNLEYKAYQESTSSFIPGFPKDIKKKNKR